MWKRGDALADGAEALPLKVAVKSEDFGEAKVAHDLEADAINQAKSAVIGGAQRGDGAVVDGWFDPVNFNNWHNDVAEVPYGLKP